MIDGIVIIKATLYYSDTKIRYAIYDSNSDHVSFNTNFECCSQLLINLQELRLTKPDIVVKQYSPINSDVYLYADSKSVQLHNHADQRYIAMLPSDFNKLISQLYICKLPK